jgi:hypothetical protein
MLNDKIEFTVADMEMIDTHFKKLPEFIDNGSGIPKTDFPAF